MRKLKLQVQVSLDGFIAGPASEMDWMVLDWDDKLKKYVMELTEPVDTIVLGRVLAQGFIPTWPSRLKDPATADEFAARMVDTPKVVFSNTLEFVEWENTVLAHHLVDDINHLKQQEGKDIITYGGAKFVSSLISHNLIDEYHLFINPVALGKGMPIFSAMTERLNFQLINSLASDCGIVVLCYKPS